MPGASLVPSSASSALFASPLRAAAVLHAMPQRQHTDTRTQQTQAAQGQQRGQHEGKTVPEERGAGSAKLGLVSAAEAENLREKSLVAALAERLAAARASSRV